MTLVELIVTLAILAVVSTALSSMIQSFYRDNNYLLEQMAATDSARRGITDTVKTIREASYGDDGSYPIAAAATSSLTVYSDTDQDLSVEKVQYVLQNGTLYKRITNSAGSPPAYPASPSATTTVATNVRNAASTPVFTYYDSSGAQLATTSPNISEISSVRIQLLVDLNPNRAPNVFTMMETVKLRNISHL